MYKEYGNIDILQDIELFEVIEYLKIFYTDLADKKMWDLYLINYANMDKDTFKSFDEWKKPAIKARPKTVEEKKKAIENIEKDTELMLMGFRGIKPQKQEVKEENENI
jgi:hypothetical protein